MIELSLVSKSYGEADNLVKAVDQVSLSVAAGESLAICGASGAGKSTLLKIMGTLDTPDEGGVLLDGEEVSQLADKELSRIRGQKIGFVFQFHNLLKDFTLLENVMMPLLIQNVAASEAKQRACDLLERVGISHLIKRYPQQSSGGEQQRAAVARALVHRPKILLADEPTGNLDERNAHTVFDLLCTLNHDLGATLIVVTHDRECAQKMNQIIRLEGGRVQSP